MKKNLLIVLLLVVGSQTFGQIQNGKILLTGKLRYSKTGDLDAAYEVSAAGGYFLGQKSALGITAGIGKASFSALDQILFGYSDYKSIGIFSRHYVALGDEEKFYFFIQPAFTFTRISGEDFDGNDAQTDLKVVSVSPGFSYYPVPSIGIEFSLTGLAYQLAESGGEDTVSVDFNPLNPSIGITFLLGGN